MLGQGRDVSARLGHEISGLTHNDKLGRLGQVRSLYARICYVNTD